MTPRRYGRRPASSGVARSSNDPGRNAGKSGTAGHGRLELGDRTTGIRRPRLACPATPSPDTARLHGQQRPSSARSCRLHRSWPPRRLTPTGQARQGAQIDHARPLRLRRSRPGDPATDGHCDPEGRAERRERRLRGRFRSRPRLRPRRPSPTLPSPAAHLNLIRAPAAGISARSHQSDQDGASATGPLG
jgi:hypothetical protein